MSIYWSALWFWLVWTNTVSSESIGIGLSGGMYRVDRRDLQVGSLAGSYYTNSGSGRRPNDAVIGGVHRVDRHDFDHDQPFSSNDYRQSHRYERGGSRDEYSVVQRTSMERTRSLPRLFIPAAGGQSPSTTSFDWRRNNYDQIMPIATYLGGSDGYEWRTPRAVLTASTPRQIYDVAATPRQIFDVAVTPARPIVHADDNALPATAVNVRPAVIVTNADDESKPLPAITVYGKTKIDRRIRDEDDRRRPTINELAESGEESDLVETFEPELLNEGHGDGGERDLTRPIKRRRRLSGIRTNGDNLAKLIDGRPFGYFGPIMYERFVMRSVEMQRGALHEAEFQSGTDDFGDNGIGSSLWPAVEQYAPNESKIQVGNEKESSNDNQVVSLSTVTEKQKDGGPDTVSSLIDDEAKTPSSADMASTFSLKDVTTVPNRDA